MTTIFHSQSLMEYEEHEKRAWSVDFSRTDPSMLVSGSDDCKVLLENKFLCQFPWNLSVISDIFAMKTICNMFPNHYGINFIFFHIILIILIDVRVCRFLHLTWAKSSFLGILIVFL